MMPKWKRDLATYRRDDFKCRYCGYDFKTSNEWRMSGTAHARICGRNWG